MNFSSGIYLSDELLNAGDPLVQLDEIGLQSVDGGHALGEQGYGLFELLGRLSVPRLVPLELLRVVPHHVHQAQHRVFYVLVPFSHHITYVH